MKTEYASVAWGQSFSTQAASLASTALDRWALAQIHRRVAAASVGFQLWDGFRIVPPLAASEPVVGTIVFKNRRALVQLDLGPRTEFRRNLHVRRRRNSRRPSGGPLRKSTRAWIRNPTRRWLGPARQRHENGPRKRPPSLRSRQHLLRTLARFRDGLYVRLLPDADCDARSRADRENGSRVSKAGAAAG